MGDLVAPLVGSSETFALDATVFGIEPAEGLLHECVKAEAAGKRQGTHAAKTRGMVAGGRAKPYRQKGTGRARQGTTRAVQFTGGGVVFGPQPRRYDLKVNRKAYRKARCMGLSLHAQTGTLAVLDADAFEAPRTKDALALLGQWQGDRPLLIVLDESETAAALSFRNVERVAILTPLELEVTFLLWARSLLVSKRALEAITGMLGTGAPAVAEEVEA